MTGKPQGFSGKTLQHYLPYLFFFGTLLVFLPAIFYDFLDVDDQDYVYTNPNILSGSFSLAYWKWAFFEFFSSNWHPLTWTAHKIDTLIFGVEPWGHHLSNILLHCLNVALLFKLLKRMPLSVWCITWITLLFAIHPTRIESVVWISEKKDLLSTCFLFLSLITYFNYADKKSRLSYIASIIFFAIGLMCKFTYVTLPCILLLLDIWPLDRFWGKVKECMVEKAPFWILTFLACIIAMYAQDPHLSEYPLQMRISNAALSYVDYLKIIFWPIDIVFYYPYPEAISWITLGFCVFVLAGITLIALLRFKKNPEACIGWLLYLGVLFPVIGIVKIGDQALANRYLYFPIVAVGLCVFPWLERLCSFGSKPDMKRIFVTTFLLLSLAGLTAAELPHWRNSKTLFERNLEIKPGNWFIHRLLRNYYGREGNHERAAYHTLRAMDANPKATAVIFLYYRDYYFMARQLLKEKRYEAAAEVYQEATESVFRELSKKENAQISKEEAVIYLNYFESCFKNIIREKTPEKCLPHAQVEASLRKSPVY